MSSTSTTTSSSEAAAPSQFRSFVTQSELDERRKKRQEEWEKVRKPDQPQQAPEEEYDARSLYSRLQEQKDKKQAEYEEAHKLKNMIKGLDDDEVHFLDLVDKTREEIELRRLEEEGREIEEYRKAVANLAEEAEGQRLQDMKQEVSSSSQPQTTSSNQQRKSQSALLAGAVKRKSVDAKCDSEMDKKRLKVNDNEVVASATLDETTVDVSSSGLTCIGVLPGLGVYTDSSDSEQSSDSDVDLMDNYDLLGRSRWRQNHAQKHAQGGKS